MTFYSSEKTYRNIENKVIIVKFIFIYYTEGLLHQFILKVIIFASMLKFVREAKKAFIILVVIPKKGNFTPLYLFGTSNSITEFT